MLKKLLSPIKLFEQVTDIKVKPTVKDHTEVKVKNFLAGHYFQIGSTH